MTKIKKCPYCEMTFEMDKNGTSSDFFDHLIREHKKLIEEDFDIYEMIIDDNWDDLIDYYKEYIKDMLVDYYEEEILSDWGDEYITEAIDELIADADEVK
jgi:hypothetical protein